jgi:DNA-binding NtrC family response regulator
MESNFIYAKNVYSSVALQQLGLIGESEAMQDVVQQLIEVAPTDLSVLITGETGTGKEVFANAIHKLSRRAKEPFVSVNCAAIPENLLESELFGYEKGAFTGAVDRRVGFFESANKGTIFLDEIGEMPITLQVKLLRILETGQYSRLGSSEVRKTDLRIIAATNRNLSYEVVNKNFRQDLFYRLNSFNIHLPTLRERIEDIPLLFNYFAENVARNYKFKYRGISEEAIKILQTLKWEGNIRELKNFTDKIITLERGEYIIPAMISKYLPLALPEHSAVFSTQNQLVPQVKPFDANELSTAILLKGLMQIDAKIDILANQQKQIHNDVVELKKTISEICEGGYYSIQEISDNENIDFTKISNLNSNSLNIEEMEKNHIVAALKIYKGNKTEASKALGISPRTLYRKLEYYGIDVSAT